MQHIYLLTAAAVILFSGCSAKTKGFIEDLYSDTEVVSASQQNYNAPAAAPQPQQNDIASRTTLHGNYISDAAKIYEGTGKIIDASYDRDVKLFIYAFVKTGESNPITFYYDKDLRPIGDEVTITVKDNFLTNIIRKNKVKTKINQIRQPSTIKTPTVEKIDTL